MRRRVRGSPGAAVFVRVAAITSTRAHDAHRIGALHLADCRRLPYHATRLPYTEAHPGTRGGAVVSAAPEVVRYELFIAGQEVVPREGRSLPSIDPTTGEQWSEIAAADAADVDRAVRAAGDAFAGEAWRSLSPTRRGRLMMRFADAISEHATEIATVETRDNGKLYREMLGQLRTIPEWLYYFGGLADKIEGRVIPHDRQSVLNYTLREPLGV